MIDETKRARQEVQQLLDEAREQRVQIEKRLEELDVAERLALALLDGLEKGEVVT